MELQWNNILIRKSPKVFSYLEDDKFLRDNFAYEQIGYFKISQGYLLEDRKYEDFRERLTRLYLQTGYTAPRWSVGLSEYYFHFESQNIFNLNLVRKFDYFHLLANYNYNSFANSNLNTLTAGAQIRPTDVLGFAILKDMDLKAKKTFVQSIQ